jgi:hypothetical protein
MHVALLKEKSFRLEIRENWGRRRKNKKYYLNTLEWWVKAVKQHIRKLSTCVGLEKRQEDLEVENFYFEYIYDILQNNQSRIERMAGVNMLKARIVKLHSVRMEGVNFDLDDRSAFINERASFYHTIQQKKCREQRTITRILVQADRTQTTNKGIVGVFHESLWSKFETISVDAECVRRDLED